MQSGRSFVKSNSTLDLMSNADTPVLESSEKTDLSQRRFRGPAGVRERPAGPSRSREVGEHGDPHPLAGRKCRGVPEPPGGTAVLVELSADIHICGVCRQQFNNLDAFVTHKQTGCQLSSAAAAPGTVQFVAEETVPITQAQTTTTTITSETQTITVSAPEFVFEHGYQTYLPTESSENQTTTVISLPAKSRTKKPAAAPAQKRLNCCYPGCQFKTAYGMKDMERHLKIHTGDKPHKCDTCGKCFSRKDKLKTHTRCHTGQKPYKCKTCDYAAADSSSLNKHLRIHSDERPFKCQLCPYASRNSSQLTVHLRSHTGDAPFQCWLCSAKFKISSDLKRHMRVHSGEKPFKCEFCHVRCTMKGNLKSHIRIKHSGDRFQCPHCAFVGDSKAALRKHSRAHQAEHPEKCSQCSYSSASKAALRVHERVHCAERPFKCSFCSFDTKQPSNLSKHLKKTHGHLAPPAPSRVGLWFGVCCLCLVVAGCSKLGYVGNQLSSSLGSQ
ncbi:PREDICTED: zinc finger protein 64 homolog, isoforms 1 and 2-like [Dipodomys ordii]|uniref:Zinc finger protein 64 homolog, isoforms 1 and 2-like n=1 Tax=Dipodomys ordii TaxID=10020 RepID=A0A1S3FV84_DIPOR|nr:PREDICTED: zinc finger protein 64 homolog, isoforms 1 and 2-like [Dipodomys ordii]